MERIIGLNKMLDHYSEGMERNLKLEKNMEKSFGIIKLLKQYRLQQNYVFSVFVEKIMQTGLPLFITTQQLRKRNPIIVLGQAGFLNDK